jgi:hypothetical protein
MTIYATTYKNETHPPKCSRTAIGSEVTIANSVVGMQNSRTKLLTVHARSVTLKGYNQNNSRKCCHNGKDKTMKPQKNRLIGWGITFLIVLPTVLQVEVLADSQEKQWVVFQERIPENSIRYSVALKYSPSEATLYNVSRGNVKSAALPEGEQIDGYKEQINLGPAINGFQYSVLLRGADELAFLNRDGRQICKVRILPSKQDVEPEVLREGYLFLGNQLDIPFELSGQQLGLAINESVPGTFSINIYGHDPYSYQGSFSTVVRGSLTGNTFIEGANLEVSVSYKESLRPNDRYVSLAIKPFEEKVPYDSASGKITDVLKLRSAKLVVEKIASDSSEIVLAVIHGDIKQSLKEESYLSVSKPVPAFARVDLIRRKLFTLEELCKKAGSQRHIVLIFGELKRKAATPDYYYRDRGQVTGELTLDEAMISKILQRDLKYPPVIVFVCRRFLISDLYETWLGQDPDFYILADYSNPMDVQLLWFPSRDYPPYPTPYSRSSVKAETLREQFVLPENKVSVLLANDKGNLVYIDVDAGQHLAKTLTEINKLISSKK